MMHGQKNIKLWIQVVSVVFCIYSKEILDHWQLDFVE